MDAPNPLRARTREFVEDSRLARTQRIQREKDNNGDVAQVYNYVLGATGDSGCALRVKAHAQNLISRGGSISIRQDGVLYHKDGTTEYEGYSIG